MYFKLVESITNLNEDKVVKFNGEVYPKFGWCVIVIGGSGMGKSTTFNKLVPIDARHFDVDEFKNDKYYTIFENNDGSHTIHLNVTKDNYNLEENGINPPFTLKNKSFVSFLHEIQKPLANKVKSNMFDMGRYSKTDRLPNIVFDMTGDELHKITQIVDTAKDIGYKVSIIWVLGDIDQAIYQNAGRARHVDMPIVKKTHSGVINSVEQISKLSDEIVKIDDFWVILQYQYNVQDYEEVLSYLNAANVYSLKDSSTSMDFPPVITAMIELNKEKLSKL